MIQPGGGINLNKLIKCIVLVCVLLFLTIIFGIDVAFWCQKRRIIPRKIMQRVRRCLQTLWKEQHVGVRRISKLCGVKREFECHALPSDRTH